MRVLIVYKMFSELMLNAPDWKAIFAPEGRLLRQGDLIQRTNLSRTLSIIASEGADGFYKVSQNVVVAQFEYDLIILKGEIADAIVAKVKATGGILTHEDLESYQVIVQPALQGTYRGHRIYTTHAPTSGPVLLHMFNLLEHFEDLVEEGHTGLNTHRIVEAMKCELITCLQERPLMKCFPYSRFRCSVRTDISQEVSQTYHTLQDKGL